MSTHESAWHAGSRVGPLALPPLDRHALRSFAAASGDPNPLHLDTMFARAAGWPDVIAHGMLSMALAGRLLTDTWGHHALLRWDVRFLLPTPVESRPSCHAEVTEVEPELLRVRVWVELDDGAVTMAGTAEVSTAIARRN